LRGIRWEFRGLSAEGVKAEKYLQAKIFLASKDLSYRQRAFLQAKIFTKKIKPGKSIKFFTETLSVVFRDSVVFREPPAYNLKTQNHKPPKKGVTIDRQA
jgi:hypothetical protein